jgi:thiamine-phosphate pyrophosphorylase
VDPAEVGERLLAGGARLLQLRWKGAPSGVLLEAARRLRERTRRWGALLIVNDRVDVAAAAEADGVHLGQDDLPLEAARRLLPPGRLVGISTHDLAQARAAEAEGADYIGFGPIFATVTKDTGYSPRGLDQLREVRKAVRLPIVAIGGIGIDNARAALEAGADAVAMISELCLAEDPTSRTREALLALESRAPRGDPPSRDRPALTGPWQPSRPGCRESCPPKRR